MFTWYNLTVGVQSTGVLSAAGVPLHLGPVRAGNYRFDFVANDGALSHLEAVLPEPLPLQGHLFVFDPPEPCTYPQWAIGVFKVNGGTPPYTYQWSNGAMAMRIDSLTSGRWQITATDAQGCRIEIDTLVQLTEPLRADVQVLGESCAGRNNGRVHISGVWGGVPPYGFSLNDGPFGTRTAWDSLAPGWHALQVQDAAGCLLSMAALVPSGLPFEFDVGADTMIFQGDTLYRAVVSSLPLRALHGQPASGVDVFLPHQIALSPYFTTTYRLTAVSEEGCIATAELRVEVRRQRHVYAPNVFWPEAAAAENRVFTLYAEASVEQVVFLQVFDRQGQLCFEARNFAPNDPAAGWDGTTGGQRAAPGLYVWQAAVRYVNGVEEHFAGDVLLVR